MEMAMSLVSDQTFDLYDGFMREYSEEFPDTLGYLDSACWADKIKRERGNPYKKVYKARYHYIDLPYDPSDYRSSSYDKNPKLAKKVDDYFEKWMEILGPITSKHQFITSLRFYIHIISDLHCPLHIFQLQNELYPKGDAGGNAIKCTILSDKRQKKISLHSLYDKAGYHPKSPLELHIPVNEMNGHCSDEYIMKTTQFNLYNVPKQVYSLASMVYNANVLNQCYYYQDDLGSIQFLSNQLMCQASHFIAQFLTRSTPLFMELRELFDNYTEEEVDQILQQRQYALDPELYEQLSVCPHSRGS